MLEIYFKDITEYKFQQIYLDHTYDTKNKLMLNLK